MSQKTWSDVAQYVNDQLQREGVAIDSTNATSPTLTDALRLGSAALDLISRKAKVYAPVTISGSALTLSSGLVFIPSSVVRVERVHWIGENGWDDPRRIGWRHEDPVVEGNYIRVPRDTSDISQLLVDTISYLPPFSASETSTNTPLVYVPQEFQYLAGDYILWKLPAIDQAGVARKSEFGASWAAGLAECIRMMMTRGARDYQF